ncbi:MAG: coenzyme F420-0:L-glutamate ligase [Gammaproteobacteria bacterium]|nr:coenzyme F420-0:L-glutamate ligase [Gammaproteobacteria bacterium]
MQLHAIPGIPQVQPGDDLSALLTTALRKAGLSPATGDIIIVAQKLISKAEGRLRRLSEVEPGDQATELAAATEKDPAIVQLILDESRSILRHRPGVIIAEHRLGMVLANAGIDRSNVNADNDVVLLFPEDPDASAAALKQSLDQNFDVSVGIVIADSVGRAWRMGTTGMAIGCAGVSALVNLRGRHDMFGRELEVSEHAVADSVASAAELLMGEADEATPVVILRGLNEGSSTQDCRVLLRPAAEDMFR